MIYTAKFEMDVGIPSGYGSMKSVRYKEEKRFREINDELALSKAAIIGRFLSECSYPNPNTNKAKVILLNLFNENGKAVNQEDFLSQYGELKDKNVRTLSFEDEDNKMVFYCSTLEHLLMLADK